MENINRAYSLFEVKSFDEEHRIIEGIATTPTPDRMDDIVESMGAQFTLPIPLLWQHKHDTPVGQVQIAEVKDSGIKFIAQIAKIADAGELKNTLDKAWQSVKSKLVRGISIGFKPIETEPIDAKDPWGGQRFKKWEWLELSLVTIP